MASVHQEQDSINLSISSHPKFLANSLFTLSRPEHDVRIHCSGGHIVTANRLILSTAFKLFRKIFGSDCTCVTHLPVTYDIICSEFSPEVLQKVLKSFCCSTSQGESDSLQESEFEEVQSILETFECTLQVEPQPLGGRNNSGPGQDEEQAEETFEEQAEETFVEQAEETFEEQAEETFEEQAEETFEERAEETFEERAEETFEEQDAETFDEQAGTPGASVSMTEKQPLDVSITIKAEETSEIEEFDSLEDVQDELERNEGGNQIRSNQCPICQKNYSQKFHLKTHIRTVHGNEKPHHCQICEKNFGEKSALKKHIRAVHEKEKPHQCETCQKKFSRKNKLNQHIRAVHENEKPHQCPICNKNFGRKSDLNTHIRIVHEKEKPHQCETCQKKFSRKNKLDQHIRAVHENEKPHQCEICQKKFSQKSNLNFHIKRVH